ncbi:MAG: hypothetical protein GKR93_12085 [Gammaproteobacteria bacterium]|nr:hypothetical protein [Gammaproteobacteria bacterium]
MDKRHKYYPFDSGYFGKNPMMAVSVDDRKRIVSNLDLTQCRAALNNQHLNLQSTVVKALQSRARKLERILKK